MDDGTLNDKESTLERLHSTSTQEYTNKVRGELICDGGGYTTLTEIQQWAISIVNSTDRCP